MTKKELEDKCKALREELDKAHAKLNELTTEKKLLGSMEEFAVGGFFDKTTRQWMLAELKFNPETSEATVELLRKTGNDFAMFNYNVNKFIAEKINLRSMK